MQEIPLRLELNISRKRCQAEIIKMIPAVITVDTNRIMLNFDTFNCTCTEAATERIGVLGSEMQTVETPDLLSVQIVQAVAPGLE